MLWTAPAYDKVQKRAHNHDDQANDAPPVHTRACRKHPLYPHPSVSTRQNNRKRATSPLGRIAPRYHQNFFLTRAVSGAPARTTPFIRGLRSDLQRGLSRAALQPTNRPLCWKDAPTPLRHGLLCVYYSKPRRFPSIHFRRFQFFYAGNGIDHHRQKRHAHRREDHVVSHRAHTFQRMPREH